jgi:hypothetical protein
MAAKPVASMTTIAFRAENELSSLFTFQMSHQATLLDRNISQLSFSVFGLETKPKHRGHISIPLHLLFSSFYPCSCRSEG